MASPEGNVEAVNTKVMTILNKYHLEKKSLIPILQDVQAEYNYLPQEALRLVSQTLGIPLIDIVAVATFFRAFSLKPRGKHVVTVCLGTACHVRGGPKILDEFQRILNIGPGETSPDRQFTLETVNCLGCCAIGPVVVVDGDYHAQTSIRAAGKIIKKYTKKEKQNEIHKEHKVH
jgi:NADH:ubiquinone oxidoreductase subunit E